MDAQPRAADRWVPALHNLYLATLLIAFVATITVDPIDPLWSTQTRVAFAGAAAAVLAAADLVMRRLTFTSRPGVAIGYFLGLGGVLGALTAVCPFYGNVSFGALPLVFVALPPVAAAVASVVLTASPPALQLLASQQFLGGRARSVPRTGPATSIWPSCPWGSRSSSGSSRPVRSELCAGRARRSRHWSSSCP